MDPEIGWRAAFVVGGALSFLILLLRQSIPESPRWLMTHGNLEEAAFILGGIEKTVQNRRHVLPPLEHASIRLDRQDHIGMAEFLSFAFSQHRDVSAFFHYNHDF